MKLAFIIPNLKGGGAEKVLSTLLNFISKNNTRYNVHLLLVKKEGRLLKTLDKNIKIFDFKKDHARKSLFDIINYLNVEEPDYFISSLDYMNLISSLAYKLSNSKSKFLIWEHNNLSLHSKKTISRFLSINKIFIKLFYSFPKKVIAVSNGVRDDLITNFNFSSDKIITIYNPAFDPDIITKSIEVDIDLLKIKNNYIIAVGRLARQKNYPNLIKAFKILKNNDKVKDLKLVIVGDGPEKHNIINLISSLNLSDEVFLIGYKINPFPLIKNASVYALSSNNEGFGLVLIEALALKKQIVSTDCPSGPREILNNGEFGTLVPVNDPVRLSEGLLAALNGEPLFEKESLLKRAQSFSVDKCSKLFFNLLNETL